jgi:hypothetical protein
VGRIVHTLALLLYNLSLRPILLLLESVSLALNVAETVYFLMLSLYLGISYYNVLHPVGFSVDNRIIINLCLVAFI